MKVYFSSSMRAKKTSGPLLEQIYRTIERLGYKHTSDFMITVDPVKFYQRQPKEERSFYRTMLKQIKAADVCVFEVSRHSLGIGFSVNLALDFGKPVILLYQSGHQPYLFSALKSDKLIMGEYTPETLAHVVKNTLSEAKDNIDIRFTFFITPKINQYLRTITRTQKLPRAVYLRHLLEREMGKARF